jgi:hypothetical protein
MTETPIITQQEKDQITEFYKLFKASPKDVTQQMRVTMNPILEKAWSIASNKTLAIDDRIKAHDIIKPIHDMLGKPYDDNWKPKASSSGRGGGTYIATKEQRKQNCNDFIAYVGPTVWNCLTPYEIAAVLANVWGPVKS